MAASTDGGPGGGSAWRHYKNTDVLGDHGAASLVGIFASKPPDGSSRKFQEDEDRAAHADVAARHFWGLTWQPPGVPPPTFRVVEEEGAGPPFRAELSVFALRPSRPLQEVRLWGPRRYTSQEARRDGAELRREAFLSAAEDVELRRLRRFVAELRCREWLPAELAVDLSSTDAERQLPEHEVVAPADKGKFKSTAEWFHAKDRVQEAAVFEPFGPGWMPEGKATSTPRLPGVWMKQERQNQEGKHTPWLFFNATTGRYYRLRGDTQRWVQTGATSAAEVCDDVRLLGHGSVCLPARASGRKDALAVALPELSRTGALLKQPLPFLDKPAALYILVGGLRGSALAAEFCAKRFHTYFLPLLSNSPGHLSDEDLVGLIGEALEGLDRALLESAARYAGSGAALAVVLGRRVAVCTLGGCRALLCRPEQAQWRARALASSVGRRTAEDGSAPPLFGGFGSAPAAAAAGGPPSSLLRRAALAAHPFAALGLRAGDLQGAGAAGAARRAALEVEAAAAAEEEAAASPWAPRAAARAREAAASVEAMLAADAFATQRLAELFYVLDEEDGAPSPRRAAALLGMEPGCGEQAAQAALEVRYRALLSQLYPAAAELVALGFRALREIADASARAGTSVWMPPPRGAEAAAAPVVSRALGLRDLKRPRRLVSCEVDWEVVELPEGPVAFALLTGGARSVSEQDVADVVGRHRGRPRAACLRLAAAASPGPDESIGALVFYTEKASPSSSSSSPSSSSAAAAAPDAKRRRTAAAAAPGAAEESAQPAAGAVAAAQPGGGSACGKPARIRAAHVLLRLPPAVAGGGGGAQAQAGGAAGEALYRRPAPSGRTTQEAELVLLELLERLAREDAKALPSRFADACRELSDCRSALGSQGTAELGWVVPGQWGKEWDAAAFDLPVGGLSDLVTTPRGLHLILRLA